MINFTTTSNLRRWHQATLIMPEIGILCFSPLWFFLRDNQPEKITLINYENMEADRLVFHNLSTFLISFFSQENRASRLSALHVLFKLHA